MKLCYHLLHTTFTVALITIQRRMTKTQQHDTPRRFPPKADVNKDSKGKSKSSKKYRPMGMLCYKGTVFYFNHSIYPKEKAYDEKYPVTDSLNLTQTKSYTNCTRASHIGASRFYKDGYLRIDDESGNVDRVANTAQGCGTVKDYLRDSSLPASSIATTTSPKLTRLCLLVEISLSGYRYTR